MSGPDLGRWKKLDRERQIDFICALSSLALQHGYQISYPTDHETRDGLPGFDMAFHQNDEPAAHRQDREIRARVRTLISERGGREE